MFWQKREELYNMILYITISFHSAGSNKESISVETTYLKNLESILLLFLVCHFYDLSCLMFKFINYLAKMHWACERLKMQTSFGLSLRGKSQNHLPILPSTITSFTPTPVFLFCIFSCSFVHIFYHFLPFWFVCCQS